MTIIPAADWSVDTVMPAASLPVSVDEAKLFSRVSNDLEDNLFSDFFIPAAVTVCEEITGLCLISTGLRTRRNGFSDFRIFSCGGDSPIVIRPRPLISVDSFSFINEAGDRIDLVEGADFFIDRTDKRPALRPLEDQYWPTNVAQIEGAVTIEFTCGFGVAPADVPADLRLALLSHVAALYDSRGECMGAPNSGAPKSAIKAYDRYRIRGI